MKSLFKKREDVVYGGFHMNENRIKIKK